MVKKIVFEIDSTPIEDRKKDVERVTKSRPNHIPIFVQKVSTSKLTKPEKPKFLMSRDSTIGQFSMELRKRIDGLTPEHSLLLFVNQSETILPTNTNIGEVYDKFKDEDGYLKILYTEEHCFG